MRVLDGQIADFPSQVAHTVEHLQAPKPRHYGVLTRIVGLTIEARGLTATVGRFAAS